MNKRLRNKLYLGHYYKTIYSTQEIILSQLGTWKLKIILVFHFDIVSIVGGFACFVSKGFGKYNIYDDYAA